MAVNRFEVLVPGNPAQDYLSVITPTNADWKRGHFLQPDLTANSSGGTTSEGQITAKLAADGITAAGSKVPILGFASKAVNSTGKPTDTEILYGGRLEGPVKAGNELSVEPPPLLMALQGTDYLDSTPPSAVNELVCFKSGKAKKGAQNEYASYVVVGVEADDEGTAGGKIVLQKLPTMYLVGATNP